METIEFYDHLEFISSTRLLFRFLFAKIIVQKWKPVIFIGPLKILSIPFSSEIISKFIHKQAWLYSNVATLPIQKQQALRLECGLQKFVVHLWHWKFDYGVRVRAFECITYCSCLYRNIYMDFEIITPNNDYDDEVNPNYMNASKIVTIQIDALCMHIQMKVKLTQTPLELDAFRKCHFNQVNLHVWNRRTMHYMYMWFNYIIIIWRESIVNRFQFVCKRINISWSMVCVATRH